MIPFILLAWSKGFITQDQSDRIKFIANSYGINSTTEAFTLLEQWLKEPPAKRTSEAALRTIRVKLENSDDEMREKLEKVLLDSSTFLSDTPGEILNFDTKMSEIARIEMNIILNLSSEKNSKFLENKKVNQELKLNK